jgi:hypothetical protein
MNSRHASEMEIQQYVSDEQGCSKETIAHIGLCEKCQAAAAGYRLLFTEIKKQPRPAFDFDVSGLLLPQLNAGPALAAQRASWMDRYFRYVMAVIIFAVTAIPAYLFRKNIFYTFTGISSFFLYTILAAALIIVWWRIADMYKKYQKRMETLVFY